MEIWKCFALFHCIWSVTLTACDSAETDGRFIVKAPPAKAATVSGHGRLSCVVNAKAVTETVTKAVASTAPFNLSLIYSSDIRSHLLPVNTYGSMCSMDKLREEASSCVGGAHRRAGYIHGLKSPDSSITDEPVVVVDLGQAVIGTHFFSYFNGSADAEVMSYMPVDVYVPGINELNEGGKLLGNMDKYLDPSVSLVLSNVDWTQSTVLSSITRLKQYVVKEVNGRQVGFLGVVRADLQTVLPESHAIVVNPNRRESLLASCAECDVSFFNGGGIRASLDFNADLEPPGAVSYGDVTSVVPYSDTAIVFTLQGKYLQQLLQEMVLKHIEHIQRDSGKYAGSFLQTGALRYAFNVNGSLEEVSENTVFVEVYNKQSEEYEPLDPDRQYKVITSSFLYSGGDGYSVLFDFSEDVFNTGQLMEDAIAKFLHKFNPYSGPTNEMLLPCAETTFVITKSRRWPLNAGGCMSISQMSFLSDSELWIGLALPLFLKNGKATGSGSENLAGSLMAIKEIRNNRELLSNHELRFVFVDSKCDGEHLEELVWGLVDNGLDSVDVVVGAACSSASIAAQRLLRSKAVPQISGSSTASELSDKDKYPYFMRTVASDSYQARAIADLIKFYNWTSCVCVSSSDAYGLGGIAEFTVAAGQRNLNIMASLVYTPSSDDFSDTFMLQLMHFMIFCTWSKRFTGVAQT
ncbi:hypothetical protein CYMTET_55932 [Cymbomonas tetramitiformis]|uniref:Receptor ligand binding region domain-containing protein n=1 Tax=Cymbomonas tetramitiformis TaxID=36881 RepID=A0AAE0BCB5_9CHLO|nr:hypothetical protein CYMTET_55932 [Cymbomonas tetramitiformis]